MFHFQAPGRFLPRQSPALAWGRFVSYIEVADDQHATRQVNVFENGNILRYDRSHSRDAFGYLAGLKFSLKPKWARFFPGAETLSAAEFETIWRDGGPASALGRHRTGTLRPDPRNV
jgi:hypothetical protein